MMEKILHVGDLCEEGRVVLSPMHPGFFFDIVANEEYFITHWMELICRNAVRNISQG